MGTTTLHKYNPSSGTWSNDGSLFFTGANAPMAGTFWEMPTITRMGDKWLFTATPQNTSRGVATLYWTGSINADGTFAADDVIPKTVELKGFARDGFGLLSPTICRHDGKDIVIGIVPDKLPSQANYELGYAHTYCLPREWSLDSDGMLCQKPYSGLAEMRQGDGFSKSGFTLDGSESLSGIDGRAVELLGEFVAGDGRCGFTLLDDGAGALKVYYDGKSGEIVVDMTGLDRRINDSGVFDGIYRSALPGGIAEGSVMKLNVFFDHSILDIFINDRWASSVRVFATAKATEKTTVFADAPVEVKNVKGWNFGGGNVSAVMPTWEESGVAIGNHGSLLHYSGVTSPSVLSVFDISGRKLMETVITDASGSLETGLTGMHVVRLSSASTAKSVKLKF